MKAVISMCTGKKNNLKNIPAIKLYNAGPWFVIRKNDKPDIDVWVVSSKYGLINAKTTLVDYYEERITPQRAIEINRGFDEVWKQIYNHYDEIFLNLGGDYNLTIPEWFKEKIDGKKIYKPKGSFLIQFACLKRFMNNEQVEVIKW